MAAGRGAAVRAALLAGAAVAVALGSATAVAAGEGGGEGRRRKLANPSVHAFYYLWYGHPGVDGGWRHWNHSVLPHWRPEVSAAYPTAAFLPPHDIHAPFYPARGLYSSANGSLVAEHFRDMRSHGIGVAVVSWWGRPGVSGGDSQGVNTDHALDVVFAAARTTGLAVALHLEPYAGRNAASVAEDVAYVARRYRDEVGWYRLPVRRQARPGAQSQEPRPVYFVYDSYHTPAAEWAAVLEVGGRNTVRGTDLDGVFVGLWLNAGDGDNLLAAGFDGGYTYFAGEGASYGATAANWPAMVAWGRRNGAFFAPSVGPGYDDTKIRPWNGAARRDREGGADYARRGSAALDAKAVYVGVSTYNEWGEGTQVEAAVPRWIDVARLAPAGAALPRATRTALHLSDAYSNYLPDAPDTYMMATLAYSARLATAVGYTEVASDLYKLEAAHDRRREAAARAGVPAIGSLPDWVPPPPPPPAARDDEEQVVAVDVSGEVM